MGGTVYATNPRCSRRMDPPGAPINFLGYVPKLDAPLIFEDIDNPARWDQFVFQAKYAVEKGGKGPKKYVRHTTPAGALIVPANDDGIREINGWRFFHRGWKPDDFDAATYIRGTATKECMKPPDRKGRLDADRLLAHGLTAERVRTDTLFFLQLLLPICDPKRSCHDGDGRMPFFSTATMHTNGYAIMEKGWGGGYGHEFKLVTEQDLIRWLAEPIRHGARDGSTSSIPWRWLSADANFDNAIANNMTYSRWRQIKSVFKLNNNITSPGRGKEGYDPASKYDLMYRTICHNMNHFTLWAELDAALDESTWGFGGYMGDCGGRLTNKPVGKGGQTTMVFDVSCC
jgi:hypothetical protein